MHCSLLQIVAETVTEVGDPKVAIYEAVEKLNIQLLVLGSHGRGAIKRLVPKVIICRCISLYLSSLITFNYKVFLQNYCACMCVWELVSFGYFIYFQIRKLWSIYTEKTWCIAQTKNVDQNYYVQFSVLIEHGKNFSFDKWYKRRGQFGSGVQ